MSANPFHNFWLFWEQQFRLVFTLPHCGKICGVAAMIENTLNQRFGRGQHLGCGWSIVRFEQWVEQIVDLFGVHF